MIGSNLAQLFSLPWIADFRDHMAQDAYPADPKSWQRIKRIEENALRTKACGVFVTTGTR